MKSRKNRILKWAVALGIVIVLNLFVQNLVNIKYPNPQYENFCKQEQLTVVPQEQTACISGGGAWTENPDYSVVPTKPILAGEVRTKGYCDTSFTCRKQFEDANNQYRRNIFLGRVIFGVLAIIGAFFVTAEAEAVSLGLSLGGVLSFVIGTIGYWSDLSDVLRVVVLGIALVALIYLGIKKVRV